MNDLSYFKDVFYDIVEIVDLSLIFNSYSSITYRHTFGECVLETDLITHSTLFITIKRELSVEWVDLMPTIKHKLNITKDWSLKKYFLKNY